MQLSGNGGGNYQWTGPSGFTSTLQNPTIVSLASTNNGVYTLVVTNANNCQASATTAVVVNINPVINISGANVCFGASATLSVSGGGTYSWSGPSGFTSTSSTPVIPLVNAATSGNYTVLVTAANGCTNTSAANLSYNTIPSPSITGITKACVNSQISLQGSGGFIYSWSGPANFVASSQNVTFTVNSIGMSGIYTLSILNQAGCSSFTTINVVVDPLPNGTLVSDGKNSCVPFCANFSLAASPNNAPIINNSWQINSQTFAGTTLNYCFITAGNFPVNANFTDANGCTNSSTFAINAYAAPIADFEYSPLKPVEGVDNVQFVNSSPSTDISNFNWYFINNNGYTSTSSSTSDLFQESGVYPVALIVKNKWGCLDTVVKTITIAEDQALFVPNSFTPNGDGINEIFQPKGKGLLKYNLMVFDRWGQKIYETADFADGWDGTFKGLECKQDSYVWKITASYPQGKVKEYTGHVTLNR